MTVTTPPDVLSPLEPTVRLPSERSFGLLFAAVFAGFAGWAWYGGRTMLAAVLLAVAVVFLALALAAPRALALPNRAWYRIGIALNAVVSPIVLGAMFLLIFVPVALVMRLAGRDSLRRRFDATIATYWIDRRPPGPPPESFKQQF